MTLRLIKIYELANWLSWFFGEALWFHFLVGLEKQFQWLSYENKNGQKDNWFTKVDVVRILVCH